MLTDPELLGPIPRRAYLDVDPGFVQLWASALAIDMRFEGHTHFVTVGLSIGDPACPVPTCGHEWVKTVPPVVLSEWPVVRDTTYAALTTVAHWRGYGSFEHGGVFYGQKAHSLRRFIDLPSRTSETFALALSIHADERKDLESLEMNGWRLLDPSEVSADPDSFRHFVQGSRGEFGITKSGYVNSRCGWFSDRSVCYLASGRPVIAQETGFGSHLPTGEGLFAFDTNEEILAAIDAIRSDYDRHARKARELAESLFDSDRVLNRLLDGLSSS
jgi:hypothetical protein